MDSGTKEKGKSEEESEGLLKPLGADEEDMASPLRTVHDVLREAEEIMTREEGDFRRAANGEEVLVDEVDVDYRPLTEETLSPHGRDSSPQKRPQLPFEIVVRHKKVVATNREGESDSDDGCNGRRKWTGEGTGEGVRDGEWNKAKPGGRQGPAAKRAGSKNGAAFRKGHRRAWSMPNAKGGGEPTVLSVSHDAHVEPDGRHRRRVVRFKEHPGRGMAGHDPTMHFEMTNMDDDDNELEVEIDEEEIVMDAEGGGKGRRTVVKRFWEARWKAQNFEYLPEWLQDNEYLRTGHRPPLPSFGSCFKSIFALHTETGNIWTHMYGCVLFVGVALWFFTRPMVDVPWQEKLVFSAFFAGAVCCLGLSFTFHTVQCHSPQVGSLFSKLDYSGISVLIMGSFVPWIHYGFYCRPTCQIIYIGMIVVLGLSAMIVSLWDKFAEPMFRPVRAGVFVAMGLSSIIPALHLFIVDGVDWMIQHTSLGWLLLMGALYLVGAAVYAFRIPERFFPGKCDLWFQSHQLFHTFVVIAALVHLHGICKMAMNTLQEGSCPEQLGESYGDERNPTWLATWLGLDEPSDVISWTSDMRP